MAELTPQERLQPSLLDRLADDHPDKTRESRERHIISLQKLRECIIRDLTWLLNTGNLSQMQELDDYPYVEKSVLNYGIPDLAGQNVSNRDVAVLESEIRRAIKIFEPRILPNKLQVRAIVSEDQMNLNAMVFEIDAEHWADPVPLGLLLRSEVDMETGAVSVTERRE